MPFSGLVKSRTLANKFHGMRGTVIIACYTDTMSEHARTTRSRVRSREPPSPTGLTPAAKKDRGPVSRKQLRFSPETQDPDTQAPVGRAVEDPGDDPAVQDTDVQEADPTGPGVEDPGDDPAVQDADVQEADPTGAGVEDPEMRSSAAGPWTHNEALLEFLLLHDCHGSSPGKWCRKGDLELWTASTTFVQLRADTQLPRTGIYMTRDSYLYFLLCRSKVLTRLSKQFRDPAEALKFFDRPCSQDKSTQAGFHLDDVSSQMLAESEQLMQELALRSSVTVPAEFIAHSLVAMERLKHAGRSNILALLAKALGTVRPDGVESLMPVHRMPVGLIKYAVNFFTSIYVYCNM